MHSHSDKEIKTCKVCKRNIRAIQKAGKELDRTGVWNLPPDLRKRLYAGESVKIWEKHSKP